MSGLDLENGATVDSEPVPEWHLNDAADAWEFAPVEFTIDELLPAQGVIWWGGPPKGFKSMLLLYICLAIAAMRDCVAGHFAIRKRPAILYVAREGRRDDIVAPWPNGPAPGALHFLIWPRFDLLNREHVACSSIGVERSA